MVRETASWTLCARHWLPWQLYICSHVCECECMMSVLKVTNDYPSHHPRPHTHTHAGTHNCVFYTDLFCCQIFSCCIILRSLIKMCNEAKSFRYPLEAYCDFLCIQKSPVIQSGIKCNVEGKRHLTVREKVMTVAPADSHIFFIAGARICVRVCLLCVCVRQLALLPVSQWHETSITVAVGQTPRTNFLQINSCMAALSVSVCLFPCHKREVFVFKPQLHKTSPYLSNTDSAAIQKLKLSWFVLHSRTKFSPWKVALFESYSKVVRFVCLSL